MQELPAHIENQIEEIWLNSAIKIVTEKRDTVLKSINGVCTLPQLQEKVADFNSALGFICDDEEDYEFSRFRMFTKGLDIILLQHPEIISELDKMFKVCGELYNLADWTEEDVDYHGKRNTNRFK